MRMLQRAAPLGVSVLVATAGCAVATSPLLGDCSDGALCAGGATGAGGAAGMGGSVDAGGVTTSAGAATASGAGAMLPPAGGAAAGGVSGAAGAAGMAGLGAGSGSGGGGGAGSAGGGGKGGAAGAAGAGQPVLGDDITDSATPIALITMPTGGGNHDLEVLRDDDRPPVGNNESSRQYDTFTSDPNRTEDWLGHSFDGSRSLMRVVFQAGIKFPDGGWFESIRVQIRNGGVWSDVPNVRTSPSYPGDAGQSFATYQFDFAPVTGDAIRVAGEPGGSARFISCGELRVFERQ
jgi:hypothetical protein